MAPYMAALMNRAQTGKEGGGSGGDEKGGGNNNKECERGQSTKEKDTDWPGFGCDVSQSWYDATFGAEEGESDNEGDTGPSCSQGSQRGSSAQALKTVSILKRPVQSRGLVSSSLQGETVSPAGSVAQQSREVDGEKQTGRACATTNAGDVSPFQEAAPRETAFCKEEAGQARLAPRKAPQTTLAAEQTAEENASEKTARVPQSMGSVDGAKLARSPVKGSVNCYDRAVVIGEQPTRHGTESAAEPFFEKSEPCPGSASCADLERDSVPAAAVWVSVAESTGEPVLVQGAEDAGSNKIGKPPNSVSGLHWDDADGKRRSPLKGKPGFAALVHQRASACPDPEDTGAGGAGTRGPEANKAARQVAAKRSNTPSPGLHRSPTQQERAKNAKRRSTNAKKALDGGNRTENGYPEAKAKELGHANPRRPPLATLASANSSEAAHTHPVSAAPEKRRRRKRGGKKETRRKRLQQARLQSSLQQNAQQQEAQSQAVPQLALQTPSALQLSAQSRRFQHQESHCRQQPALKRAHSPPVPPAFGATNQLQKASHSSPRSSYPALCSSSGSAVFGPPSFSPASCSCASAAALCNVSSPSHAHRNNLPVFDKSQRSKIVRHMRDAGSAVMSSLAHSSELFQGSRTGDCCAENGSLFAASVTYDNALITTFDHWKLKFQIYAASSRAQTGSQVFVYLHPGGSESLFRRHMGNENFCAQLNEVLNALTRTKAAGAHLGSFTEGCHEKAEAARETACASPQHRMLPYLMGPWWVCETFRFAEYLAWVDPVVQACCLANDAEFLPWLVDGVEHLWPHMQPVKREQAATDGETNEPCCFYDRLCLLSLSQLPEPQGLGVEGECGWNLEWYNRLEVPMCSCNLRKGTNCFMELVTGLLNVFGARQYPLLETRRAWLEPVLRFIKSEVDREFECRRSVAAHVASDWAFAKCATTDEDHENRAAQIAARMFIDTPLGETSDENSALVRQVNDELQRCLQMESESKEQGACHGNKTDAQLVLEELDLQQRKAYWMVRTYFLPVLPHPPLLWFHPNPRYFAWDLRKVVLDCVEQNRKTPPSGKHTSASERVVSAIDKYVSVLNSVFVQSPIETSDSHEGGAQPFPLPVALPCAAPPVHLVAPLTPPFSPTNPAPSSPPVAVCP